MPKVLFLNRTDSSRDCRFGIEGFLSSGKLHKTINDLQVQKSMYDISKNDFLRPEAPAARNLTMVFNARVKVCPECLRALLEPGVQNP